MHKGQDQVNVVEVPVMTQSRKNFTQMIKNNVQSMNGALSEVAQARLTFPTMCDW